MGHLGRGWLRRRQRSITIDLSNFARSNFLATSHFWKTFDTSIVKFQVISLKKIIIGANRLFAIIWSFFGKSQLNSIYRYAAAVFCLNVKKRRTHCHSLLKMSPPTPLNNHRYFTKTRRLFVMAKTSSLQI